MIVTPLSGNQKIGPVAATYRAVGPTCPPDCPLLPRRLQEGAAKRAPGARCYAGRGHTASVATRAGDGPSRDYLADLRRADGAPLIRHLVSGDWLRPAGDHPRRRVVDRELLRAVVAWHREPSQRYTIGWGYTHGPRRLEAAGFGPGTWPAGLEILASCHTKAEAADLQRDGWRTARVAANKSGLAAGEVYCPYDLAKHEGRPAAARTTCAACRLCMPGGDGCNPNIVFLEI